MSAEELHAFYWTIGAALWHLQYLEDVLVNFLAAKIIKERRCTGTPVSESEANALIAEKRRCMTLGRLITDCSIQGIIQSEHQSRFAVFKLERDWLVHRSLVESGDDLYAASIRSSHGSLKRPGAGGNVQP